MTKFAPDTTLDAFLDYIAESDKLTVCSTQPTSYAEATGTYMLAEVELTAGDGNGDYVIADDTSGRKLTVAQQLALAIVASADAEHVALSKVGDTTLRYVTTCTLQALVSGGTVDVPSWKINLQDPS